MPAPLDWPPRGGESMAPAPDGRPGHWHRCDNGRLWVAERFRPVLEQSGLLTFDALFVVTLGTVVREIGPRCTRHLPLGGAGETRSVEVYLKRFGLLPWRERLKNWVRLRVPDHGARGEFRALCELTRLGIPTVEPLCFGESNGRSLLITAGLTGYRDLKALLQSGHPLVQEAAQRHRILDWLVEVARSMHGAGFHHQDLYLNHVLVGVDEWESRSRPDGGSTPVDVRLIDLGRVRQRRPLGRRWILKDLAQLHYSSRGTSSAERMRFYRRYLGRKLTPRDRALIRAILRKSAAIDRHTRRHDL